MWVCHMINKCYLLTYLLTYLFTYLWLWWWWWWWLWWCLWVDSDAVGSSDVGAVRWTSTWHSSVWIHRRTLSRTNTWSVHFILTFTNFSNPFDTVVRMSYYSQRTVFASIWVRFSFPLFSALKMVSSGTKTLLIVDHKKIWKILIPFNLESIIVHLVMQ